MGKAKQSGSEAMPAPVKPRGRASGRGLPLEQAADPRLQPFTQRFVKSEVETTRIPVQGDHACMGAAAYLAVLAFPKEYAHADRDEFIEAQRDEFIEAVKASLLKGWRDAGPDLAERIRRRKEIGVKYSGFKSEHSRGILSRAFRRIINWRLRAAEIAYWQQTDGLRLGPWRLDRFYRGSLGRKLHGTVVSIEFPSPGRKGLRDASRAMSERMRKERGTPTSGSYPNDIFKRVIKSSEPVLHLALPLRGVILERRESDLIRLMGDPGWLGSALRQAETFRCGFISTFYPDYKPQHAICLLPKIQ